MNSKLINSETMEIQATEAKAKFSNLLERARLGESFVITLHGQAVARLVPARRVGLEQVRQTILEIKASRFPLNPPGKPRLSVRQLRDLGRP